MLKIAMESEPMHEFNRKGIKDLASQPRASIEIGYPLKMTKSPCVRVEAGGVSAYVPVNQWETAITNK
jgi:hypothetical protein